MISKLYDFLFRYLLSTGSIALVCMFVFGLSASLLLHHWEFVSFSIAGVLCFLGGIGLIAYNRRGVIQRTDRFWQRIGSLYPFFEFARRGARLVLSTLCLVGITLSFQGIVWYGGVSIGLIAAEIGAYETAERVFVLTTPGDWKGNLSLTDTWDGQQFSDFSTELLVNDAIKTVYGASSGQIAHRFAKLGERHRAAGVNAWLDHQQLYANGNFAESVSWYRKSLSLYQKERDLGEYFDALTNIAYCQTKLGHIKEALVPFKEARAMIWWNTNYPSAIERLGLVASYAGNYAESNALWALAEDLRSLPQPYYFPREWLPLIGLAVIVFIRLARNPALTLLAFICFRTNKASELHHYDRMVTLELARGRIDKADAYCKKMLRLIQSCE